MEVLETVRPGMSEESVFHVAEDATAAQVGSGALDVLATPSMIAFMERLSFELLERHLPDGNSSVGVLVNVRHLAPTPLGGDVRVRCEVLEVDGRAVTFAVHAWDAYEKVGEGRHQRIVIDKARFMNRVEEKKTG